MLPDPCAALHMEMLRARLEVIVDDAACETALRLNMPNIVQGRLRMNDVFI